MYVHIYKDKVIIEKFLKMKNLIEKWKGGPLVFTRRSIRMISSNPCTTND